MSESAARGTARRVAVWSVGTVSIAAMLGTLVIMFVDRSRTVPSNVPAWSLPDVLDVSVNVGVPVIGMVLALRRPENRIGWVFLAAGFALGMTQFGSAYAAHALRVEPGSLPAALFFGWLGNWLWPIPIGALPMLFLWFPTGGVRSPRWRPVQWLTVAITGVLVLASLVAATATWRDPISIDQLKISGFAGAALTTLFVVSTIGIPIAMIASFWSVALRFVRSTGEERLQLKWVATAAAFVAVSFSLGLPFGDATPLSVAISVSLLFLYVAIGIAVLRYRLFEIDVVIRKTVVFATLVAFITVVYVGLVAGVGTLAGNRRNPLLSAGAAALVAVAFQPVRSWARRLANRLVYGRRATPYEVLAVFSERAAGTYDSEDVLPRMVRILADGTGATSATVWLVVSSELRSAAAWPADRSLAPIPMAGRELPAFAPGERAFPVRHGGELLGAITVVMPPNDPLSGDREGLLTDVAGHTALVLRNVRLIEELRESRRRIVAAQDARAKALERNLHDGAQQQLIALAVRQRLAEDLISKDPDKARELLAGIRADTQEALETLRDLARGIYPPLLADRGLEAALSAQARKAAVPVEVEAVELARYPQEVEAAVYFCCLEALQNVAKYANATRARVRLSARNGDLDFEVEDDGSGFDPSSTTFGSGLQGMADRLDAINGSLEVRSAPGQGTTVAGRVPVTTAGS